MSDNNKNRIIKIMKDTGKCIGISRYSSTVCIQSSGENISNKMLEDLIDGELVTYSHEDAIYNFYKLTEKGKNHE